MESERICLSNQTVYEFRIDRISVAHGPVDESKQHCCPWCGFVVGIFLFYPAYHLSEYRI